MEDTQPTRHDDVVLADLLRIGTTADHSGVLLLCDAWQSGRMGQLVLEMPAVKVPHFLAGLQTAQGVGQELESAQSAQLSTPPSVPAARATAAARPTSPNAEASVVASFLLAGAWLHLELNRKEAQTLQAHLSRALGPG